MDNWTDRRPVDQLAGDGCHYRSGVRLGPVTYAINLYEVRTSLGDTALGGLEARVRLLNHAIDPAAYFDQLLTLEIYDGRQIVGFISEDGASLVRTGVLV
jgi:hypothetical protein